MAERLQSQLGMKPVTASLIRSFVTCASLTILAGSAWAVPGAAMMAKKTVLDKKVNVDQCSIVVPDETGRPQPRFGMTRDELVNLASLNAEDERWVRWYIGGNAAFDNLMKPVPPSPAGAPIKRIAGWARCEDMQHFIQIANVDLYMTPKMSCSAGPFNYTLRFIGNQLQFEMSQIVPDFAPHPKNTRGGPMATVLKTLMHEPVQISQTPQDGCALQVTQTNPDAKNLKICLSTQPTGTGQDGTVSMNLAGRPLPANLQNLTCKPSYGFMGQAQHLLSMVPGLPAAGPTFQGRITR